MNLTRYLLALSVAASLSACGSAERYPEASAQNPDLETIAILGTNDIHGALAPDPKRTREEGDRPGTPYETGGVAYLASYVAQLRAHFGSRLLWLDAGDQFQGTIESNLALGAPMVEFFNRMGLNASAVGNHEFDFGLPALKARMGEAHYPYLGANIESKDPETPEITPARWPNLKRSALFDVGGIKVGVIGLSTTDTPRTTRAENVATLRFAPLKPVVLSEAHALRHAGAEIVVIVAHVGLKCDAGRAPRGVALRRETDPQGACGDDDEMVRLLRALPKGTVDAVVAGHSHQIVHHWVAGVPVIEGGASGRYFNLVYLTYDTRHEKLLDGRTEIEGPIPVCPKIFKNQGDCDGDRAAPPNGRGPLVRYSFHGQSIGPEGAVDDLVARADDATRGQKEKVVGRAARPIDHVRFGESPLGDLVADAVREAAGTRIAIVNSGGIRAPLEAGPITYGDVFRALPFENEIVTLKLTGRELKLLLRIGESGSRGFMPVSGVKVRVIGPDFEAPSTDLNGDHRDEAWEVDRLLDAELSDGSRIEDGASYTVATLDFLVTGGDDLGWFMSRVPADRIRWNTGGLIRDALAAYLGKIGTVNTESRPVLDPSARRIVFEKPKKGRRRRPHRRHHARKRV